MLYISSEIFFKEKINYEILIFYKKYVLFIRKYLFINFLNFYNLEKSDFNKSITKFNI